MKNKVLFVGDINVDIILGGLVSEPVPDKEVSCTGYAVTPGSSAFITAAAYSLLGGNSSMAGLAGQDPNGKFMLSALKEFGIGTKHVEITTKVSTGVTVNLIKDSVRTQITYPGTIAAFSGKLLNKVALREYTHIHFSGAYQQTKFRPKITGLLKTARKLGLTTSMDPQWDMTEKWEHMKEWLPLFTYFFVNEAEAGSITKTASPEKAFAKLLKMTACPVLKLGKKGAMGLSDGKIVKVNPFSVKVKDTTGAGDNFAAGFLFATFERKMNMQDALRFGNSAGARSCMFTGGVGAKSTYKDIIKFMEGKR
ncbi:MAG: hypothetical protein A2044_06960 [Candidatus Firestonebacteria bacterium GWA2_43_8]|nr:MAG: hypothetical protein A2044_06960 [Candidatus Firestonebacteria bacterium GWA2_43_8]